MQKNSSQVKKQLENKTILIWKMAIASALSWEISKLLGSVHPYLAPLSVILCLQTTIDQSIRFSYHRMTGTIIGILVVVLLGEQLQINGWTLGGLILIGCFLAKWLKRDESVLHQVALTVLLVFIMEHKSGEYPIDRFRDTLIGAATAVMLHMAVKPPNFTQQVIRYCHETANHLTAILEQIVDWLQSGLEKHEGKRLLKKPNQFQQELKLQNKLLTDAKESLTYNSQGKFSEKEIRVCEERMVSLNQGASYILSMIEALSLWSQAGTMSPEEQTLWSGQLKVLIPLFQQKENPLDIHPPEAVLKVQISEQEQMILYPLVLYYETVRLLGKLD